MDRGGEEKQVGESRRKDGVAGGGREGPWEEERRGKEEGMGR